jgi:hypothetical protein
MAWLETKGDVFRIRFRYGGINFFCRFIPPINGKLRTRWRALKATCG